MVSVVEPSGKGRVIVLVGGFDVVAQFAKETAQEHCNAGSVL